METLGSRFYQDSKDTSRTVQELEESLETTDVFNNIDSINEFLAKKYSILDQYIKDQKEIKDETEEGKKLLHFMHPKMKR